MAYIEEGRGSSLAPANKQFRWRIKMVVQGPRHSDLWYAKQEAKKQGSTVKFFLDNNQFLKNHGFLECTKGHKFDVFWLGKQCPYCANVTFFPDHITSRYCWCEPELFYTAPESKNEVWVHKEIN